MPNSRFALEVHGLAPPANSRFVPLMHCLCTCFRPLLRPVSTAPFFATLCVHGLHLTVYAFEAQSVCVKFWPGPSVEMCRGFCCINFGGFCRGFSWRIFLGTFSHKYEERKSATKSTKKTGGPKNKIREKSVLPRTGPKKFGAFFVRQFWNSFTIFFGGNFVLLTCRPNNFARCLIRATGQGIIALKRMLSSLAKSL